MKQQPPYNPWSEGDKDHLDGLNTNLFRRRAKQLLKEKRGVSQNQESSPSYEGNSMEARILKENPGLTLEELERRLQSY